MSDFLLSTLRIHLFSQKKRTKETAALEFRIRMSHANQLQMRSAMQNIRNFHGAKRADDSHVMNYAIKKSIEF